MSSYRRLRAPHCTFFFTVALADRSERLLTAYAAALRKAFVDARSALPFVVDAVVVLPEHLHCIWTLPRDDRDVASRWSAIKAGFSRQIPRTEALSSSRASRRERGVWQRRFWEHVIEGEEDYLAHLNYIHYNPVKHGHVARPVDWQLSSFHRYVKAGFYPADWAASQDGAGAGFGE